MIARIVVIALALLHVEPLCAEDAKAPTAVKVHRDIPYALRGETELLLDAHLPHSPGPHPAALVIHGGAWRSGSKGQLAYYAQSLARRGIAALAITYRLAPEHKFPAQLEDCQTAVTWIRENAEQYDLDATRIGAIGYSAGGHLAAMLATQGIPLKSESDEDGAANEVVRLVAVAAGGAPLELRQILPNARTLAFWLGATRGENPDIYRQASPAAFVGEETSPLFFFHGDGDRLVPLQQHPRVIMPLLEQSGVEAKLHVIQGAGHLLAAANPTALDAAFDFLQERLRTTKP